jgi:uncharacterized protein (TIGR00106 family)
LAQCRVIYALFLLSKITLEPTTFLWIPQFLPVPRQAGIRRRERREAQETMKAIAEVQVIPIGAGVSVRKEVMRAHELLEESGLSIVLHANGSNMEGELGDILEAIRDTIETLHAEGVVRLSTHIKIGTRMDKVPTMEGKLFK